MGEMLRRNGGFVLKIACATSRHQQHTTKPQAGLLAPGSSHLPAFPRFSPQWLSRLSSPVTAAGPLPNRRFRHTGFPIIPFGT